MRTLPEVVVHARQGRARKELLVSPSLTLLCFRSRPNCLSILQYVVVFLCGFLKIRQQIEERISPHETGLCGFFFLRGLVVRCSLVSYRRTCSEWFECSALLTLWW